MSEYLNASDTAKVLGVSRRTVIRWIQRGQLRAFVDGAIYRVHRDDLQAFIDARTTRRSA